MMERRLVEDLNIEFHGLSHEDLNEEFYTDTFNTGAEKLPLRDIIQKLEDIYCGVIGIECNHIMDSSERRWFQNKFESKLNGDNSLKNRPMQRVIEPLSEMGANISSENNQLPITISPGNLKGGNFDLNLGSAQVKSAIIFAALCADGETKLREIKKSRNHTEIMLMNCTDNIKVVELDNTPTVP